MRGKVLIEFPVTIGLAGALLLPVWAAVGAVAAMVTNCTIEVERTDEGDDEADVDHGDASEAMVVEAEVDEESATTYVTGAPADERGAMADFAVPYGYVGVS